MQEPRHPEEVGKIDNPSYCLYHRMLGHPTKNCYIFKDVFQALINAEVLKLRPEQKKVSANMMLAQRPITLILMMINSCSYSTNNLVFN